MHLPNDNEFDDIEKTWQQLGNVSIAAVLCVVVPMVVWFIYALINNNV